MPYLSFHKTTLAVAAVSLLAIVGCSDNATITRPIQPATASLGKAVTGSTVRMIFGSSRDGNIELYSMNPDGTDPIRLTNNAAADVNGVWSPDGRRIAFVSQRDNPRGEIYTMNADGSGLVRLTNTPGSSQDPSWSKDGKQIVFTSNRDVADPTVMTDNDFDLYVMNADGTGVLRLTNNAVAEYSPIWSPDGRQIAFLSNRDHPGAFTNDLYVMNADGTQATRLTAQAGYLDHPSWDPHGRRIAFSVDESAPNTGIYILDVASLGLTRLTFGGPNMDQCPSWSPDGTKLAFESRRDGVVQIYSMNADGTGQTRLTFSPQGDSRVRWSR